MRKILDCTINLNIMSLKYPDELDNAVHSFTEVVTHAAQEATSQMKVVTNILLHCKMEMDSLCV